MNLYWDMYKKLEKEVLKISEYVIFNDKHLDVYSLFNADLIVRIAIEIEAISKELYFKYDGTEKEDIYFDTDCINLLNDKFNICDKIIYINNINYQFSKKEIQPLKKADKRGKNKWKKSYQALKHNRYKNLEKATIRNLIEILGALYILNIYNFEINNTKLYSEIFTPSEEDVTVRRGIPTMFLRVQKLDKSEFKDIIYVKRYSIFGATQMLEAHIKDQANFHNNAIKNDKVKKYLENNKELESKETLQEVVIKCGGGRLYSKLYTDNLKQEIMKNRIEYKVLIEKNIYSEEELEEICRTQEQKIFKSFFLKLDKG